MAVMGAVMKGEEVVLIPMTREQVTHAIDILEVAKADAPIWDSLDQEILDIFGKANRAPLADEGWKP